MTRSERAMQVWQILLGTAHNGQTITYGQLATHLEFQGAGVFAPILGCIMRYCQDNKLPPLTCLVVNQTTGLPGDGLTTINDLSKDREAVYKTNWYALPPIQISNFEPYCRKTNDPIPN